MKKKMKLFLDKKGSKFKILLDLNITFCVAVGDLFGTMVWFIVVHEEEMEIINTSGIRATYGWNWESSRDYDDIWMLTLNKNEIAEFRAKYKDKFFRNKKDGDGTVYERRGQITFRIIYRERRRIRQEEKREREMLRIERLDQQKEEKKISKEKKKGKKI